MYWPFININDYQGPTQTSTKAIKNSDRKLLITDNRKAVPTSRQVYIEKPNAQFDKGDFNDWSKDHCFPTFLDSPGFLMDKINAST